MMDRTNETVKWSLGGTPRVCGGRLACLAFDGGFCYSSKKTMKAEFRFARLWIVWAILCGAVKLLLTVAPESVICGLFCAVPAHIAAFYYGVPLDSGLAFTAKGVTLAVTSACAATDFFALIAATRLAACFLRGGVRWTGFGACTWWRAVREILLAWGVTLVVNSLRIIALVPVDALFPKDHAPIVHLLVGVAFFLPVFALIWYSTFKEATNEHRQPE